MPPVPTPTPQHLTTTARASLTTPTPAVPATLTTPVHSQTPRNNDNEGKIGNKRSLLFNMLIRGWMKKTIHPSNPHSVISLNPYNGTHYFYESALPN
ncbi:hypothetical protein DEO72_LG2g1394 [Vigna unguiculata]|uniref:Uncharacterized protein n=1 Tax=Vigna unguiculata TaxID=3917 RepID=A0A4D6KWB3_VIGUN|nr:hypothetical protein DEO72_LG2g1394 [Vigna unguiculata]